MDLEIDLARGGDANLLTVRGYVDLSTSPVLLKRMQDAMRGTTQLVVGLAGVDYIDSSGVAVLVQGLKECARRKIGFALRDPSPRVDGVLELAGLHALFEIRRSGPGGA